MENNIEIFENVEFGKVRTVAKDSEVWFVGKDVAEILGYKDTAYAISTHCKGVEEMLVLTNGGNQLMKIIHERDVYVLIQASNKKTANFKYRLIEWFKSLGFLKEISFKTRGEVEFSEALQKALEYNGCSVINQYAVGGFKIDMFIPEINVAIEYDEKAHKYQKESDAKREQDIKALINCEFIRVDEQDGLFYNLGKVIVEIKNLEKERGGN